MGLETKPKCAVRACCEVAAPLGNLCDRHQVPGLAVEIQSRRYVITSWYAEHEGTSGIVLLNDFALGDLFGDREAFRAKLTRQGSTAIRLLTTPEELEDVRKQLRVAPGKWSGPWLIEYPWESGG
jgi:hypothetical protein